MQTDIVKLTVTTPNGKTAVNIQPREIAESQIKNLIMRGLIVGAVIEEPSDAERKRYSQMDGSPAV